LGHLGGNKIILKWVLKKLGRIVLTEHCNEPSGSIKDGQIL